MVELQNIVDGKIVIEEPKMEIEMKAEEPEKEEEE